MAKYRLSQTAEDDLGRIWHEGFAKWGEAQADKYYYAFFERFELIANQPYLFQAVDDIRQGYRRSVCGADSIYYRIEGDVVEIMSIIGQQDF